MSSILKALRKVEDQHPGPRETGSWSHEFSTAKALKKQARRSWGIRTAIAVALLAVFLGTGSFFLYNKRTEIHNLASLVRDRSKVNTSKNEIPPGKGRAYRAPVQEAEPLEEVRVKKAPVSQKPRPDVQDMPITGKQAAAPKVPMEQAPPNPVTKVPETEPVVPPGDRASGPESPSQWDVSGYRLEAIVWSKNPESRFAVINGHIVKAGGYLDDISITAIERNSVRIRAGEEHAELRFAPE